MDRDKMIQMFGVQEFRVLPEHIKLLKSANISWKDCEFGAPAIDCKRPYGNSSVLEDIAEILGIAYDREADDRFTPEQESQIHSLHKGTQMALQIILTTSSFETGLYRAPKYSDKWERVAD